MRQVLVRHAVAVLVASTSAVLVAAGPAAAHVGITPSTTAAGSTAELALSVPHGCDGAATTRLSVQIPTGVLGVVPTRNSLWDVETEVAQFTQPVIDAHGNEVTERVTTLTWTAVEPLPDGIDDELSMTLQLPAEEGTQLWFPVVQQCRGAESAWIEVAEGDVEEGDLEMPAPTFTTTAAEAGHDEGHGAADPVVAEDDGASAPEAARSGGDSPVLGVATLVIGLLGVALGGTALLRQRRAA